MDITREDLLKELIEHIDDPGTTDNSAIQALRVLKRYDRKRAVDKAMEMRARNLRFVAVREILLSIIDDTKKDISLDDTLFGDT